MFCNLWYVSGETVCSLCSFLRIDLFFLVAIIKADEQYETTISFRKETDDCGDIAVDLRNILIIDPAIVRLIWVIFSIAGGAGFWAYIIAWVIIPENPKSSRSEAHMNDKIRVTELDKDEKSFEGEIKVRQEKKGYLIGVILVVLGAIFLANNFLPRLGFTRLWPLIVLAVGVSAFYLAARRNDETLQGNNRIYIISIGIVLFANYNLGLGWGIWLFIWQFWPVVLVLFGLAFFMQVRRISFVAGTLIFSLIFVFFGTGLYLSWTNNYFNSADFQVKNDEVSEQSISNELP